MFKKTLKNVGQIDKNRWNFFFMAHQKNNNYKPTATEPGKSNIPTR